MTDVPSAHPLADLIPPMSGGEYRQLVADIGVQGLLEAIVLYEGKVLDGRHRLRACVEAEVEPRYDEYTGDQPAHYVISQNVKRRHLTPGQLAMVAVKALPPLEEEAARRRERGLRRGAKPAEAETPFSPGGEDGKRLASDDAAELVGSTPRGVQRAKRVAEQAPELAKQVEAGELELGRAERILRDHEAAVKRAERAQEEAVAAEDPVPLPDVRHGDFREVLADTCDVDLVFTDPPYSAEDLPLWSDLGAWAAETLKPGGWLVAYSGQHHLPDVLDRLREHLDYLWLGWLRTPGPAYVPRQRPIHCRGKPILFFCRSPVPTGVRPDDEYTSEQRTRDQHEWEQDGAAARYYIETLTAPGGLVVDPFVGAGTFGQQAWALGRKFIGAEIDAEHVVTARRAVGQ